MTVSSLKPRDGLIPEVLKLLKDGFDDSKLDVYERNLYIGARLSTYPEVVQWKGEILHQLALRAERRGDMRRAFFLYRLAIPPLHESTVLGEARCLRDWGIRTALVVDPTEGVEQVRTAYHLHEVDLQGATSADEAAKGERQLRIGHGYLLRARVVADDDRHSATEELINLTIDESRDFSLRDQKILVDFTTRLAHNAELRELHRRQLELNARRLRPLGTATSITRVVIDTELRLAGQVATSLLRKEWKLPRPW